MSNFLAKNKASVWLAFITLALAAVQMSPTFGSVICLLIMGGAVTLVVVFGKFEGKDHDADGLTGFVIRKRGSIWLSFIAFMCAAVMMHPTSFAYKILGVIAVLLVILRWVAHSEGKSTIQG